MFIDIARLGTEAASGICMGIGLLDMIICCLSSGRWSRRRAVLPATPVVLAMASGRRRGGRVRKGSVVDMVGDVVRGVLMIHVAVHARPSAHSSSFVAAA